MGRTQRSSLAIEYALLGFLQREPLHGYEIHQRLQAAQALGLVWHLKQAQLYALLARLEADGLIVGELIPQDARPPKRLLAMTEAGRTTFERWVRTPVQHGRDLRIEFLAKLFWAQELGNDAAQALIDAQREACRSWLAALEHDGSDQQPDQPYAMLVARFRLGQIRAMLLWLDECETILLNAPIAS